MNELFSAWRIAVSTASLIGTAAVVITIILLIRKTKQINRSRYEFFDAVDELMNKPDSEVARPLIPLLFTQVGAAFSVLAFGLSGLFLIRTQIPVFAQIGVASALAAASEICMSLAVYAFRLKRDNNIIFIPKAIGFYGKVFSDVPAGKKGAGIIRIFMNGQVVSVTARSVDEVRLARGTDVKILYADDDRTVVVERNVPDAENPFDRL